MTAGRNLSRFTVTSDIVNLEMLSFTFKINKAGLSVSASPLVPFVDFRLDHSDLDSVRLAQSLISVTDSLIVDFMPRRSRSRHRHGRRCRSTSPVKEVPAHSTWASSVQSNTARTLRGHPQLEKDAAAFLACDINEQAQEQLRHGQGAASQGALR